jgi:hypothetical protein
MLWAQQTYAEFDGLYPVLPGTNNSSGSDWYTETSTGRQQGGLLTIAAHSKPRWLGLRGYAWLGAGGGIIAWRRRSHFGLMEMGAPREWREYQPYQRTRLRLGILLPLVDQLELEAHGFMGTDLLFSPKEGQESARRALHGQAGPHGGFGLRLLMKL